MLNCENGCISRHFTISLLAASSDFWQFLVQISGKQVVGMGFLPENYDQNYHNYLQVRREPHGVSCTATLSPLQNRLSPACIHIVLLPCCHFPHRRFQKHTRGKRQNDLEKHRQDDHTAYVWNNTPVFILQIVMLLIVKAPMYKQSPMIFFSSGIIIMCRSVLFSIDLTSSPFS